MTHLGGVWPATLTMFDASGDFDPEAQRRHVEYLISAGASGVVVAGTSGEFIALSDAERLEVIRVVVEAVAKRVPVYAGSGQYTTAGTIELSREAERIGADGLIIIPPYYQKPSKREVLDHYRAVRSDTHVPLMLYHNPGYAGVAELTTDEIVGLFDEGVVGSVKSTVPSPSSVSDLIATQSDGDGDGGRLRVFYGSFQAPLEALLAGAHGWISGFPNLLTQRCVALFAACQAGNVADARAIWLRGLLPVRRLYRTGPFVDVSDLAIYRAGLDMIGQHGGACRLPLQPLSAAGRERLADVLAAIGAP